MIKNKQIKADESGNIINRYRTVVNQNFINFFEKNYAKLQTVTSPYRKVTGPFSEAPFTLFHFCGKLTSLFPVRSYASQKDR